MRKTLISLGLALGLMVLSYGAVEAAGKSRVSGGVYHTIALKHDGTVWTWGDNEYGQLGIGNDTGPQSCTAGPTCSKSPVQVSGLSNVVSVATGEYHTVALKSDGTVWSWGYNYQGELGDGTTIQRNEPVQVSGLSSVVSVAAGYNQSTALKSDGTVWAWGNNYYGQLGDGTGITNSTPVQVSGLSNVVSIAGRAYHTIALKSDGTLWAWGYNYEHGPIGDGTTTNNRYVPVQVSILSDVAGIATGAFHSIAVKSDGTVWTWGDNEYGQLGINNTTDKYTPVQVSGLSNVVSVGAGNWHSIAVKSDGTVFAWGANNGGNLGDNTQEDRHTPVQVYSDSNQTSFNDVVAISGGGQYFTIAIKSNGSIWVWGYNGIGQLGDGTTTMRLTPVEVVLP